MALSTIFLKTQIAFFKPFADNCTIETARAAQSKLGQIMFAPKKSKVCVAPKIFRNFIGEWIAPKDVERDGVILYLHGGGYVAGNIDYARGFGSVLAARFSVKVFTAAYRLAPEFRFPAPVEDALEAFDYLIDFGYSEDKIFLCGESAGGGLVYSLCLKLKELNRRQPAGIIAMSPWTDLTQSGESYAGNADVDPSMTKERLDFYSSQYASPEEKTHPLCSPLFGELSGIAPSLIFVGGDEVMLDDARNMREKLEAAGCRTRLVVSPGMWHAYPLFGVEESKPDFELILEFLKNPGI